MLSFLLDEHVSPEVAAITVNLRPEIPVTSIPEWDAGVWVGENDEALLRAARSAGLTLVTYDLRTIPPLLKRWAEAGETHGGIVFVDERTTAPNDFGALARSLIRFWDLHQGLEWTNRLAFLQRAQ